MPKPVKKSPAKKKSTAKRPSSDPNVRARQLLDQHMALAGETDDTLTPPHGDPFQEQLSAYMAKLGAKGGRIGGKRRLETLTAKKRSEIAKKAANARWKP